ncbi:MAG TPA: amidohydrolase family protein [Amycolatopsis sp.]|nr:amidohydrolase family protein [Amycolatopsis sp.]
MPNRVLVRNGSIVSMDPTVGDLVGDLLIEDGVIGAVGPDLQVDEADMEVVDASDHVVIPGFIDTHRHMYQNLLRGLGSDWSLIQYCVAMFGTLGPNFTATDMYLANKLAALDALDAGVTGVFDWSHNQLTPEHTDALIEGIAATGIRAQFGYGGSMEQYAECLAEPFRSTTHTNAAEVRRLRDRFPSDDGLITLGLAARGPELSVMEVVKADWALARELNIRINSHLGQGVFPGRPALMPLLQAGLLGDDLTLGHCNLLEDEEMKVMADHGVTATVTPEDESNMGHGFPPILRLMKAGVVPNIGVDTCVGVGGDQFTAMRFALGVPRAQANAAQLDAGENPWDLELSARDVLEMATIAGARALGQADRIGSLAPGKQADLVLINAADVSMTPLLDPVAAVVHHASRSTVTDVFVAGNRVKKDGRLVGVDGAELHRSATAAAQGILERSGVKPGWKPATH